MIIYEDKKKRTYEAEENYTKKATYKVNGVV